MRKPRMLQRVMATPRQVLSRLRGKNPEAGMSTAVVVLLIFLAVVIVVKAPQVIGDFFDMIEGILDG